MNKKLSVLALLMLTAGCWYVFRHPSFEPSRNTEATQQITVISPVQIPVKRPATAEERDLRTLSLPTAIEIREEAAADPHSPPRSLLMFASALAPRLKTAMQNEAVAHEFVMDLKACVLSGSGETTDTIRALCLRNAKLLASKYQSLDEKFSNLLSAAAPSIVELAE